MVDLGLIDRATNFFLRPKEYKKPTPKEKKNIQDKLYKRQKGKCKLCGETFGIRHLELDHIIPWKEYGSEAMTNKQLLCSSCNKIKGTGTMAQARKKLKEKYGVKPKTKSKPKKKPKKKSTPKKEDEWGYPTIDLGGGLSSKPKKRKTKKKTKKTKSPKKKTTKKRRKTYDPLLGIYR